MSVAAVLLPVLVQIALTLALLWWTGHSRFAALRAGAVDPRDIALGEPAWPAAPTRIANAYANQFQLPVLFYVVVVLAMLTNGAGLLFVVGEWLFVLSRLWHAGVHTTSNDLLWRFRAFVVGFAALVALLLLLVFHVLVG